VSLTSENLSVIILAAGNGTRMQSSIPKVLHRLAGQTLLNHVLKSIEGVEAEEVILVLQKEHQEQIESTLSQDCLIAIQKNQKGTGDAVRSGLEVANQANDILVLCGDMPLLSASTLTKFLSLVSKDASAVLTAVFNDPKGYGRIIRDKNNAIHKIVEESDATPNEKHIQEVNSGVMLLRSAFVRKAINEITPENNQGEIYLTDLIEIAILQKHQFDAINCASEDEILGINNKRHLSVAEAYMRKDKTNALLDKGATIIDPTRVDIRGDVSVGRDVEIDVDVIFEGNVSIGNNVKIGPFCILKDVSIADGSIIESHSSIDSAEIGSNCTIGPYARIRPGVTLQEGAKIGNFVEIKNSSIGKGSKVNHLSYVGDAEVSAGVNIGAGTVTCNYDGAKKHKTIIEDNVFVGSGSMLVAPVTLKKGSTIGAGSTITKDAPSDSLTLERSKQVTVDNWSRPTKEKK
jgi:bifunctional UDP-N-acetylglucosamine pyrophosphorylase/glucosamine-1-phosphate N-acetyltransferase